jgi:hypothetical protein
MMMIMMMIVEQSVELLAIETEALGENLPSATLSTTNPTLLHLGSNPAIILLSYGTASTDAKRQGIHT